MRYLLYFALFWVLLRMGPAIYTLAFVIALVYDYYHVPDIP